MPVAVVEAPTLVPTRGSWPPRSRPSAHMMWALWLLNDRHPPCTIRRAPVEVAEPDTTGSIGWCIDGVTDDSLVGCAGRYGWYLSPKMGL